VPSIPSSRLLGAFLPRLVLLHASFKFLSAIILLAWIAGALGEFRFEFADALIASAATLAIDEPLELPLSVKSQMDVGGGIRGGLRATGKVL